MSEPGRDLPRGRDYYHLAPAPGSSRADKKRPGYRTPCTSELHTLLAALPAGVFEAALTRWILAQGVADLDQRVVALDGKALRGSQGHQLAGVHLLIAYSRDVEAVIALLAVTGKTDEHKTALELLKLIPLKETLITGDAAFTRRDFCEAVVAGGGESFLMVKDNQPTPEADIRAAFSPAFPPREEDRRATVDDRAEARGEGHGRVEVRRIRTTTRPTGYLEWSVT